MLGRVAQPLTRGTDAFPAPRPYRGTVDELVHESLCYRVVPGHRPLFLDLHVPRPNLGGSPPPVVVWVHGGAFQSGSRRRFPVDIERHWLLERLLLAGFAVALVDYRLSAEAAFPGPVDDLDAAVVWLADHADELGLDADRIALWGESAGAHLVLLTAARSGAPGAALVRAVVDWYAPTELDDLIGSGPGADDASGAAQPGDAGEAVADDPGILLRAGGWGVPQASPLHAVTAALPPTLVAHGRDDRLVPPEHSVRLHDRLVELGVDSELVLTDGGHVFEGSEAGRDMIDRSLAFLGERLGHVLGPVADAELAHSMAALGDVVADPLGTDDPVEARRRSRDFMSRVQPMRSYPVAPAYDTTIELPDRSLGLRVQRSLRHTDTVLLYVHGGGFVVGNLDSHQVQSARLGAALPAHVVQLDYRLAPEHPFPAAYDDTLAAITWCLDHLDELGCSRLVLAGDSAGGNLVLAATLACRDQGLPIAAVVVNYPAVDMRNEPPGLPATYRADHDPADPRLSVTVADLRRLPPIVLGIGGFDFLLEDNLAFAHRLRAAGVDLTLRIFPPLAHGYFSAAPLSVAADRASEQVCRDASRVLWDARTSPVLDAQDAPTTVIA